MTNGGTPRRLREKQIEQFFEDFPKIITIIAIAFLFVITIVKACS